jgi:hypothetical protein
MGKPASSLPRRLFAPLALLSLCAFALPLRAATPDLTEMLEMRDGVHLATDVYLPNDTGPWPVILERTPYGRGDLASSGSSQNNLGRVFVGQDVRGRFDSEGANEPFITDGWGALQDGYDTIEWIAAQPWCDGHISIRGSSAKGMTSLFAMGAAPPALSSVFASQGESDLYSAFFTGGVFRRNLVVNWLDNVDAGAALPMYLAHPLRDSFWEGNDLPSRWDQVNVPLMQHSGWFDIFLESQVRNAVSLNTLGGPGAQGRQLIVIGPWTHTAFGEVTQGELTFPSNATNGPIQGTWTVDFNRELLHGVNTGVFDGPWIQYYLMGDVDSPSAPGNEWLFASQWPPEDSPAEYYLRPDGVLSRDSVATDRGTSTSYVNDPNNHPETIGGNNLFWPAGPRDQRSIEVRSDVVTFTTPTLTEPVAFAGPVRCKLYVSSTTRDADFFVKLCDVYPDGRSMLMAEGAIQARHRLGDTREDFMKPGEIYELDIFVGHLALALNVGHRLRISVASSNSPRYEINPQTGAPFAMDDTNRVVGTHTIHHGPDHPSALTLPLLVGTGGGGGSSTMSGLLYR